MIDIDWKENFSEGKELVLAACSKAGTPNANIVVSLGFVDGRLLIADCRMETTISNIKDNSRLVAVGGYIRLSRNAETFSSGKYFDIYAEKSNGRKVNNAIVIDIEKVFNLDAQKMLFDKNSEWPA